MYSMKAGIRLGSLGTGSLKKDLQRVLAIGVSGVQLRVADGELSPGELSPSGREELADYIESFGFEIPALSGELGGFGDSATVDERVSRTRDMLGLCVDLHAPLLTVDTGAVSGLGPRDYDLVTAAVRETANYALERDVRLALSTGTEGLDALAKFIAHVKSEGVRVNYDPAELCRRGNDPMAGIQSIVRQIAHVQARDAVRGNATTIGAERALTKGDAQIEEVIRTLHEESYDGFLTVAWDRDEDLAANAVEAVTWLKRQNGVEP